MCLTPLDQRRTTVCFLAVITACILHIFHGNQSFKKKKFCWQNSVAKENGSFRIVKFYFQITAKFFFPRTQKGIFLFFVSLWVFFSVLHAWYIKLSPRSLGSLGCFVLFSVLDRLICECALMCWRSYLMRICLPVILHTVVLLCIWNCVCERVSCAGGDIYSGSSCIMESEGESV